MLPAGQATFPVKQGVRYLVPIEICAGNRTTPLRGLRPNQRRIEALAPNPVSDEVASKNGVGSPHPFHQFFHLSPRQVMKLPPHQFKDERIIKGLFPELRPQSVEQLR